jgi:hypothetical protein
VGIGGWVVVVDSDCNQVAGDDDDDDDNEGGGGRRRAKLCGLERKAFVFLRWPRKKGLIACLLVFVSIDCVAFRLRCFLDCVTFYLSDELAPLRGAED